MKKTQSLPSRSSPTSQGEGQMKTENNLVDRGNLGTFKVQLNRRELNRLEGEWEVRTVKEEFLKEIGSFKQMQWHMQMHRGC